MNREKLYESLRPKGQIIPNYEMSESKPVLSLVGDILSYRRCKRQYGLTHFRGFHSAFATQEFVGTFAHRCLSNCFKFYQKNERAPADKDIVKIFYEVREILKTQGRRPHSWHIIRGTGLRLMRLNKTFEERGIYDKIVDTERMLQTDKEEYVIQGIVDVIQQSKDYYELWDYKATKNPYKDLESKSDIDRRAAEARLKDYGLQLRLYAYLHHRVWDIKPSECKLLFINEVKLPDVNKSTNWENYTATALSNDEWNDKSGIFFNVPIEDSDIDTSLEQFRDIAMQILDSRRNDYWPAPKIDEMPDEITCNACDAKWSCSTGCEVHKYDKRLRNLLE